MKESLTRRHGNDEDQPGEEPQRPDLETGYRREGVGAGVVALGVVALLLLIFILQNRDRGTIDLLFWQFEVRTWVGLLVAATLGFVAGYLFAWVRRRRRLAAKG